MIEKKNPLKQGLKLLKDIVLPTREENWKEESIKTRIETYPSTSHKSSSLNWKEESIKTRIETPFRPVCRYVVPELKRRIH